MWEAVQLEMERSRVFAEKHKLQKIDHGLKENPMADKVICGSYGRAFGRRTWNCTYETLKSRGLVASIKLISDKPGSEFFLSDLNKWTAPSGEELFSIRAFGIELDTVYSKFTKKIDYRNLAYLTRLKLENYRSTFISNAK